MHTTTGRPPGIKETWGTEVTLMATAEVTVSIDRQTDAFG